MSTVTVSITEVREISEERLAVALDSGLKALPEDLYALSTRSHSLAECRILGEAITQVEKHGAKIAGAFKREFGPLFDEKCASRPLTTPESMSISQATLVDDTHMEQQIAFGNLIRKTRIEIDATTVFAIETRVGQLAAGVRLEGDANPIGPETLFEALRRACEALPTDGPVKLAVLNGLQPHMALGLGRLYRQLNEMLVQHGVVPKIRHTVEKAADLAAGTGAGAGGSGAASSASAPQMTLSQALSLRELLPMATSAPMDLASLVTSYLQGSPETRQHGARMLADQSGSLFTHAMATPVDAALLAELSALQNDPMRGADIAADSGNLLAALQRLAHSERHPLDQLTGELVAVVFDHLLHDRGLGAASRAEIARLQVVAFKAALLDRSFFARREHPLRKLLSEIADAATDPQIDAGPESRFVQALRAIIDDVRNGFAEDLAIFAAAGERLAAVVAELRLESEREVAALAEALAAQEAAEEARARATEEIERRMHADTPDFVRAFLLDIWPRVVAEAAKHDRANDEGWDAALQLVDDLLWSLEPKSTEDMPRLRSTLPKLVAGLTMGMKKVEAPAETQEAFLDQLMHAHTALLQPAKPRRGVVKRPIPPPPPPAPRPDEPLLAPELAEIGPQVLERGTIVELADVDPPVRARVVWANPKRTVYLFMARGANARQMSAKDLSAALREQTVRVIDSGSAIVEQALAAASGGQSKRRAG